MKKHLLIAVASLLLTGAMAQKNAPSAPAFVPQTVVFKVKPQYRAQCAARGINATSLQAVMQQLGNSEASKLFPKLAAPATQRNVHGQMLVDLSLIYELHYTAAIPVERVVQMIRKTGMCEYAEPKYINYINYTPNDPSISSQYFLGKINAFAAWDIEKGDTNVVIGIVDTGTDWDHPDLQSNIKYNYADPINGIDDDGDGYIDNYRGWDISMNDNNPMNDLSDHGSHVSGCADAVTDNATGVASPGFHCKYLPVKVAKSTSTTQIDNGYEGIAYAAAHGCNIINCSWGGPGGGSYAQDVINFATYNYGCLVVAAAGNNGNNALQYPAAFDNVLAVASTTSNDTKSSFSSFGEFVDVCAPGSNIFSTVIDNSYTTMSGTSMASPITAGAAAIVKSHFPAYTGTQVGEQLRVTADNIYGAPGNGNYANQLGTGRINMYRALTESSPAVRYERMQFTDNNDNSFVAGDTVRLTGIARNYLAATTNLSLTLSTTSTYVTILNSTWNAGVINTLDSMDNNSIPFTFKINATAPQNAVIPFKIVFADGTYNDFQIFNSTVNVDYINIAINRVATSVTSKGRLGYNVDGQLQGLGFNYDNLGTMMYDGGLMVGINSTSVSDVIRGIATGNDQDFQSALNIEQKVPSVKSDFDTYGKFNDNPASPKLNVLITHRAYAWTNVGDDKYVMVEYSIKNTGASSLTNLYAGLCFDWDIQDYTHNKAAEDGSIKLGYAWNTDAGGLWAGVKVLTPTPFVHYAIDNVSGGAGGVDLYTGGFGTDEKYTTLSTGRATAGGTGVGNDVLDVVSTGPFNIAAGDSQVVAFAIIAGDDLADMQQSAGNAQIKYDNLATSGINENDFHGEVNVLPNPVNQIAFIDVILNIDSKAVISITDVTGRLIDTQNHQTKTGSNRFSFDASKWQNGIYFVNVSINQKTITKKFVVVH